jgi:hypothetical protein
MTKQPYKTRSGTTQFKPVMTEQEYRVIHDDGIGFCLGCGEETLGGVEPDARRYICEECGQPKVYGLEELLMMTLVVFKETDSPHP